MKLVPGLLLGAVASAVSTVVYATLLAAGVSPGILVIAIGVVVGLTMGAAKPTSHALPPFAALFTLLALALGLTSGMPIVMLERLGEPLGLESFTEAFPKVAMMIDDALVRAWMTAVLWGLTALVAFFTVRKRVQRALAAEAALTEEDQLTPTRPAEG